MKITDSIAELMIIFAIYVTLHTIQCYIRKGLISPPIKLDRYQQSLIATTFYDTLLILRFHVCVQLQICGIKRCT